MEATDNNAGNNPTGQENENVIDVDIEDEQNDGGERKTGRRSIVWKHFEYIKGATELNCPYCKTKFACDPKINGTSSLASHLYNVCKTSPLYRKNTTMKKQSTLNFKQKAKGEGSTLETHSFNQERCRKSLARLIIKDNQPFSIVDDEGFRDYSWELQPNFKLPSRWTVARDCLEIYKEEAKKLKEILKNQTVSLTTDTWTSVQNANYMCLTAVNKTEVDIYLSDGMEKRDENFDILGWWKIASLKFPILSQVARHVLAMPISTVASESAFSIGGRVIDLHRSSLTAKTAEALICTQDWVRNTPANLEHQEMAPIDLEELIDNLERIELDEFEPGQKLFETCMDDE